MVWGRHGRTAALCCVVCVLLLVLPASSSAPAIPAPVSTAPIVLGPGTVLVESSSALASALSSVTINTIYIGRNGTPPTSMRLAISSADFTPTILIQCNTTVTSVNASDPSTLDLSRQLGAIRVVAPFNLTFTQLFVINQTSRYNKDIASTGTGVSALNLWPSLALNPNASYGILNVTSTSLNGSCTNWAETILNPFNVFLGQADTLQTGGATIVNSTSITVAGSLYLPEVAVINLTSGSTIGLARVEAQRTTLVCETDYLNPDGTPVAAAATAAPTAAPPAHRKTAAWVWVVVALGIGLGIGVCLVVGVVFYRRRRRQRQAQASATGSTMPSGHESGMLSQRTSVSASRSTEESGKLHRFDSGPGTVVFGMGADLIAEVKLGPLIGRGAFGKVYKARWKGAIVAVKIVEHRSNLEQVVDVRVARETLLSSSVLHPNVVATYKIATFNSRHRSDHSSNDTPSPIATAAAALAAQRNSRGSAQSKGSAQSRGSRGSAQSRSSAGSQAPVAAQNGAAAVQEDAAGLEDVMEVEAVIDALAAAAVEESTAQAVVAGGGAVDVQSAPAVVQDAVRRVQDSGDPGLAAAEASLQGEDMFETWMLLEFCDRGSLSGAIDSGRFKNAIADPVKMVFIYRCLLDIASGMQYLHSLGILHGDLKAANVLLKSSGAADSRGFTCKLADFGLSRMIEAVQTHVTTTSYGTISHMPAELISKGKLTRAVDVYSFGIIMWELITSRSPFSGMSTVHVIYLVVNQGYRPPVPEGCPEGYAALMQRCWAADADSRPSFTEVETALQQLHQEARAAVPAERRRRSSAEAAQNSVTPAAAAATAAMPATANPDAVASEAAAAVAANHVPIA